MLLLLYHNSIASCIRGGAEDVLCREMSLDLRPEDAECKLELKTISTRYGITKPRVQHDKLGQWFQWSKFSGDLHTYRYSVYKGVTQPTSCHWNKIVIQAQSHCSFPIHYSPSLTCIYAIHVYVHVHIYQIYNILLLTAMTMTIRRIMLWIECLTMPKALWLCNWFHIRLAHS